MVWLNTLKENVSLNLREHLYFIMFKVGGMLLAFIFLVCDVRLFLILNA